MQHVFIIGSKGIPSAYGGYETFVDKLTEYHQNNDKIKYHVACKSTKDGEFKYHNARCFKIKVPNIGPAQAIYYDVIALNHCCNYIEKNHIKHPIIYILACRIGIFITYFQKKIHRLGGVIYVNPDGHEWKRTKWNIFIRRYWKMSESIMVKHADLLICDSKNIEKYIQKEYEKCNPNTTFIAYGSEIKMSTKDDDGKYIEWLKEKGLTSGNYYLVVGRFVPENSFEIMIREFMKSKSKRDFVIITTTNKKFLNTLEKKLHFHLDSRIKFVGTVYDQRLLKKIRENAYGYLHGHTVGGTNPSLLEALGSTNLNLLINVKFNQEVAQDAALYWNKKDGNLANLIDTVEVMNSEKIKILGIKAKERIRNFYSWEHIVTDYEKLFLHDKD